MEELARWGESLMGLARLRLEKRRAVSAEDFAEASRLKKREAQLLTQLGAVREAACAAAGGGAATEERQQLEAAKRNAVAQEDFAEAGRLKKRLKALDEQGGAEALGRKALEAAAELTAEGASTARAKASAKREVKDEPPPTSPVPGLSVEALVAISNEDLWQRAWAETWQKSDVAGLAEDEKAVYARAQKVWRGWMAERDRIARERADAEGRRRAEQTQRRGAAVKPEPQATALSSAPAAAIAHCPTTCARPRRSIGGTARARRPIGSARSQRPSGGRRPRRAVGKPSRAATFAPW